jgi:hypothetical protein
MLVSSLVAGVHRVGERGRVDPAEFERGLAGAVPAVKVGAPVVVGDEHHRHRAGREPFVGGLRPTQGQQNRSESFRIAASLGFTHLGYHSSIGT